jgi:hypothetical protein
VLLTRSRLCPGPKPGSSLHLHVLGTPPAFVLSQDQTLREELPQRVVRNVSEPSSGRKLCRDRRLLRILGLSLVGSDPCAHGPPARGRDGTALNPSAMPMSRNPMYTEGSGAQDGVNSGTAVRSTPRKERSSDGVEPGHISRPGFGRRVCMLLSFQRPSHRFWREILLRGAPRVLGPARGRTHEYSAQYRGRR